MLDSSSYDSDSDKKYSTFNIEDDALYSSYLNRSKKGCFEVSNIQECYLVSLKKSLITELIDKNLEFDNNIDSDFQISQAIKNLSIILLCNVILLYLVLM